MLKFFAYYCLFVLLIILLFIFKVDGIITAGNIFVIPILGQYYLKNKPKQIIKKSKLILSLLVITFLSDIIFLFPKNDIFLSLQILLTISTYFFYMSIFRIEGAFINLNSLRYILILIVLVGILFIVYGLILTPTTTDLFYFLSIVYSIVLVAFILQSFFRKISKNAYIYSIIGVSLKLIGDTFYAFFNFKNQFITLELLNFFFYAFSQFFLILSLVNTSDSTKIVDIRSSNLISYLNKLKLLIFQISHAGTNSFKALRG